MKQEQTSIRSQVTGHFREAILSGALSPGDSLPSTQELARSYGTREANIHQALTVLVKEGLITRIPRVGTIVSNMKQEMKRVAVYVCDDLRHPRANYLRILLGFLEEELNRHGIECLPVNENRELSGMRQLERLATTRRIQGIIMPGARRQDIESFRRIHVPFSCLTTIGIDNRVRTDRASMLEQAFTAFKNMDCRRIGMLCSYSMPAQGQDCDENDAKDSFHRNFQLLVDKYHMTSSPKWLAIAPGDLSIDQYAGFAYDSFRRIWANTDRPDALFVYTDDLIPGLLMAVLRERVDIPRDLKLVMHRSRENKTLCPVPCTFVENSVRDIAAALVSQICDLYHGKAIQTIVIPYRTTQHQGD